MRRNWTKPVMILGLALVLAAMWLEPSWSLSGKLLGTGGLLCLVAWVAALIEDSR